MHFLFIVETIVLIMHIIETQWNLLPDPKMFQKINSFPGLVRLQISRPVANLGSHGQLGWWIFSPLLSFSTFRTGSRHALGGARTSLRQPLHLRTLHTGDQEMPGGLCRTQLCGNIWYICILIMLKLGILALLMFSHLFWWNNCGAHWQYSVLSIIWFSTIRF